MLEVGQKYADVLLTNQTNSRIISFGKKAGNTFKINVDRIPFNYSVIKKNRNRIMTENIQQESGHSSKDLSSETK